MESTRVGYVRVRLMIVRWGSACRTSVPQSTWTMRWAFLLAVASSLLVAGCGAGSGEAQESHHAGTDRVGSAPSGRFDATIRVFSPDGAPVFLQWEGARGDSGVDIVDEWDVSLVQADGYACWLGVSGDRRRTIAWPPGAAPVAGADAVQLPSGGTVRPGAVIRNPSPISVEAPGATVDSAHHCDGASDLLLLEPEVRLDE